MRTKQEFEEMQTIYQNKIADLEAKLAESEKENKTLKDIRTLERVVPRNAQLYKLSNRDCYLKGFENAISETIRTFEETYGKEKCKLVEERDKYLMDIVKVGGYEYQIEELKQQLAEKDKKLEKAKSLLEEKLLDKTKKYLDLLNLVKQDKISFCIERLEKVLNFVDGRTYLAQYIKEQIEELKKEMK